MALTPACGTPATKSTPKLVLVPSPGYQEGELVEANVDNVWMKATIQYTLMGGDWVVAIIDDGRIMGSPKGYFRYPHVRE